MESAVKTAHDHEHIRAAILDGRIDVVATDHAPHTKDEKNGSYFNAPSGGALVQHALVAMLDWSNGLLPVEKVVDLMAHRVALVPHERPRIHPSRHEGRFGVGASQRPWTVREDNVMSKCGWSPFTGHVFKSRVHETWVNGTCVWDGRRITTSHGDHAGQRLTFNR